MLIDCSISTIIFFPPFSVRYKIKKNRKCSNLGMWGGMACPRNERLLVEGTFVKPLAWILDQCVLWLPLRWRPRSWGRNFNFFQGYNPLLSLLLCFLASWLSSLASSLWVYFPVKCEPI